MPPVNIRVAENSFPIEEIDDTMRFLSRFRKQRPTYATVHATLIVDRGSECSTLSSDEGQAEPPNGAVQFGPPNKPTHPPPTKPTKPIKKLREGYVVLEFVTLLGFNCDPRLSNIWSFDATETRQASVTPTQFGPPNRPTKPPQPPRPQPKKAADADGH